jgi:hypothetical protein
VTRSLWRRTAPVLALCLVGLTGLSGCRTQAGVAAFVGPDRISEDRLSAVVDEGLAQKAIAQTVGTDIAAYRQLILGRLIKHQLIGDAARKAHVSANAGDIDTRLNRAVQQTGGRTQLNTALAQPPLKLPPSELRPFLRDLVLLSKMGEQLIKGTTFTDAQARKYYDDHGGASSGQTFEQLKSQVLDAMRADLAQQKAQGYVSDYVRSVKVQVNPRYGRFESTKLFDSNESPLIVAVPDGLVHDTAVKATPSAS